MSWSAADVTLLVVHYDTLHEMKWLNLASRCPLSFTDPHDTPYVKQIVLKSCSLNWALLEVWTYTGLTVRLRFSCRRFGSIRYHDALTMHCILNFQFYFTCIQFCQYIQAVRYMNCTFNFTCSKKTRFLNVSNKTQVWAQKTTGAFRTNTQK